MVFSPLSFTFWRGIIWIPEMRGKGVQLSLFFLVFNCSSIFCSCCFKLVSIFVIIYCSNFGFLFWGLGVFWVSFGSLLGSLDSFWGGSKKEKMVNVPRENHFCENAVFWLFEALDGPLGFILASLGPIWSKNGPQNGFQKFPEKLTAKC